MNKNMLNVIECIYDKGIVNIIINNNTIRFHATKNVGGSYHTENYTVTKEPNDMYTFGDGDGFSTIFGIDSMICVINQIENI